MVGKIRGNSSASMDRGRLSASDREGLVTTSKQRNEEGEKTVKVRNQGQREQLKDPSSIRFVSQNARDGAPFLRQSEPNG
jgi:hypothetical protein